MKEFILGKKEEVIATYQNVPVKANENKLVLSVILTSERIVLLKNVSNELLLNEFLKTRMVNIPEELEVALIIPFPEIKELKYIDGVNIITFKDNYNEIDIEAEDFNSFRLKLD